MDKVNLNQFCEGRVLVIEQTVGRCDDGEARTDMFKISHQDKEGNVVFQEINNSQVSSVYSQNVNEQ